MEDDAEFGKMDDVHFQMKDEAEIGSNDDVHFDLKVEDGPEIGLKVKSVRPEGLI